MEKAAYDIYLRYIGLKRRKAFCRKLQDLFHSEKNIQEFKKVFEIDDDLKMDKYTKRIQIPKKSTVLPMQWDHLNFEGETTIGDSAVGRLLDMMDPDITWDKDTKNVVLKGFGAFEELNIFTLLRDFMDKEDWEDYLTRRDEDLVKCLINTHFSDAALEKIKKNI